MKENAFIYDYNNLLTTNIGDKEGVSFDDIIKINDKITKAYSTVFDKPVANTKAILEALNKTDLNAIKNSAKSIRSRCDAFVVLGIGGSALGANAIFKALTHFRHNELPKNKRNAPRFFVEDNVDPTRLNALLDVIDLNRTVFCVVSKSGNTTETLSQFFAFRKMVEAQAGEAWKEHFVVVTDDNQGKLNRYAEQNGLERFFIPNDLGGRYSVLSPVGLLPAAVLGLNIDALVAGAKAMYDASKSQDVWENAPLLSAVLDYINYTRGKCMSVVIPYCESLDLIGDWYSQLWAESLGRNAVIDGNEFKIGQTPVKALGTSAQHSQFQLYLEGPSDKIFTFIAVQKFKNDIPLPADLNDMFGQDVTKNRNFSDLINIERVASTIALTSFNRPSETITISEVNECVLGKIFMFFILKTLFMGALLKVNPYNQPAVESIKIGVKAILKSDTKTMPLRTIEV